MGETRYDSSVSNRLRSPAIMTGRQSANERPVNPGADGVIFIDFETQEIFSFNLETLTWILIGSGSGGGTPDVSTTPHVIYKNALGQFDNSPTTWDVGMFTLLTFIANAGFTFIEATAPDQKIMQLDCGGVFKNLFNLNKLNGALNDDFLFLLGKGLQSMSMEQDDNGTGERVIRIGNANQIVPFGTPIRRIILDEIAGEVFMQCRDGAEENGMKILVDDRGYGVEVTTAGGAEVVNYIKIVTQIVTPNRSVTLVLGHEALPGRQIRIIDDSDTPNQKIIISDETDANVPWMIFDISGLKYSMNADRLQRFDGNADALLGGLSVNDLYRVDALNVNAKPYSAIAIVT